MEPYTHKTGKIATLLRGNIDTDQIIPKEFLKSIRRTGYGEHLFDDWRYNADGTPNPQFELNQPQAQGASILVAGNNFGCGSSREHAVWAIVQYGFHTIIAPRRSSGHDMIPGFADIFRNNSLKNGLLLIELDEPQVAEIAALVKADPSIEATIDLPAQTVSVGTNKIFSFVLPESVKQKLIEGLDDIGTTERFLTQIDSFEKNHHSQLAL